MAAADYDVVIAGAGPAGAQCARDLAARDYEVLVLETEPEADFPKQSNKSTAGTFPPMLASFGVPDEVVQHFTEHVVLESPNEHYTQDRSGAVMDFAGFKQFLVRDGRDRGAEYEFDARVSRPLTEGGDVTGVRYDGDREVTADIVVDATGPAAPLASALNVVDLQRERQAIGVEYEFEGVAVDHSDYGDCSDAMMLRLDHDLAPGGYAWLFHTGGDTAKVGLCYIQNESHAKRSVEGMTIDDYLDHWLQTDPRFDDAERIEGRQHRGSAHIQPPSSLSTDSFMAIGDTVPTIDPLWGEGIHKGMESGRAAAITADACLTPSEPDTSAAAMATYDELWHDRVAPRMRARLLMTELLYLAPNDRYDRLLRDLDRTDEDTPERINRGDAWAIRNLVHLADIPLLARFARQQLAR
jgi:digeranylgeranylglycerophospholipid reductase